MSLSRVFRSAVTAALLLLAVSALPAQAVRVASLDMSRAGQPDNTWLELAHAVARYDVVAAGGVRGEGDMEKVLAGLGDRWEAVLNGDGGFFGFFYNDRLEVVKELGTWGRAASRAQSYGVRFRVSGSALAFTIVACRLGSGDVPLLSKIEQHFETLTANRRSTVLAAQLDGARPAAAKIYAAPGLRLHVGPARVDRVPPQPVFFTLSAPLR